MGGEIKMKDKECPLNRNYYCDDRCKWFDDESDINCSLLIGLSNINIQLYNLKKTIFEGLDALFQKS